ncbi:hypothetical protein Zmor_012128 [Zophobas morio]|uniref:Uncharacterized protein n=1 Tax=Zophobas morio TaxID=2755281 RepID=A0AA38HI70_9CUCU|nr:hypothetical protein Zmor_012128 [Zophobas morio]
MNEENLNTYDYLELYSGIDEEGNPIPDNDDTSRMNTAIDAMFSQGLFTDEKLFGKDGTFKKLLGDGYYIEKNEGSAFKDTFLYKVNEDVNKAIRADIDDYYDSVYSNVLRMSKSQYKYTLQSLKDVIDVINNDKQFQKFSGLKELNKLVYDYVKTNPHILRRSDFASVTTRSQPFKTIYEFNNGGYGYSDEAQFTEYANYKTPSGLRL